MRKIRTSIFILIVVVLGGASYLLLHHLSYQPFQDDEALYAEVTRESLLSHNFLSFTYRDEPYFNKPPALFWLMGVSQKLVSNPEEAARLPSAVAGIALVLVTIFFLYEATGNWYWAALGGGILATTASFEILSRAARFDSLVTLWIMLALYACMRAIEDRRWFLWYGAFVGLAFLTKGPVAIYAVIPAVAVWFYCKRAFFKESYFWAGVGLALLIIVPWHIYETIKFGSTFWQVYIFGQLVDRIDTNLLAVPLSNASYISYLLVYTAPWFELALLAVLFIGLKWRSFNYKTKLFFIAACTEVAVVICACFVMHTKTYRYLYPLYPCMAVVIALAAYEFSKLKIPNCRLLLLIFFIALGAYAFCWSAYTGFYLNPSYPYLTNDPRFLAEEKTIGSILIESKAPNFYVFDTVRIRPIIFYSKLINPYNIPTEPYVGELYMTMPADSLPEFTATFPHIKLAMVYKGQFMLLAKGEYVAN